MLAALIKIQRSVGPHLPLTIWKISNLLFYNPLLKVCAKYADWKEQRIREGKNTLAGVPPPSLRLKVAGGISEMSVESFLRVGEKIQDDIENILLSHLKRNLSSFHDILDFGCGPGRALIWLHRASTSNYYGTDIDKRAIEWCQNNLKFAEFSVNNPTPPLSFKSESYDFIYSVSVFTHIDEEMQLPWIQELHRVLRPKGILLISVLGPNRAKIMPKDIRYRLQSNGFVFVKQFPKWYQPKGYVPQNFGYHTEGYIHQNFGKYFKLLSFIEKGILGQDAALLEKK